MKRETLYGKAPILETFRAGRRRLFSFQYASEKEDAALGEALRACAQLNIRAEKTSRAALEARFPQVQTQGWAAEVSEYPYFNFGDLSLMVKEKRQATVLALDHLQDPQNLGAILRSAECSGVDGVIIPEDRSSRVTPAVCKAAAGAQEYLHISLVTNLVQSFEQFKEMGFWIVGTSLPDANGGSPSPQNALSFDWPDKTILVLGGEGEGMKRLVKASCDFLIHLPLSGRISSLNVSAAAAICLYEIVRKKSI